MQLADSAGTGCGQLAAAIRPRRFPRRLKRLVLLPCIAALLMLRTVDGMAQELTPRAYWPAPKGTRVLVAGLSHSDGDVFFDPSVPLYAVKSKFNAALLAYLQTFSLFGRTSNVVVKLPYVWGTTSGLLGTSPASSSFSNFADFGATVSVNLLGAPSMSVAQFQQFRTEPRPVLGVSVEVTAPTGNYSGDRLINEGANRWAFKPEIGLIYPLTTKWHAELEAGAWFFDDDDQFVAGKKEQDPVYTYEVHLVRRFRPGFWASLDWTYYTGGRQTVGGDELSDEQSNSRLGTTLVIPFARRYAIKLGYAFGLKTRFGTDFDQFLLSYSVLMN